MPSNRSLAKKSQSSDANQITNDDCYDCKLYSVLRNSMIIHVVKQKEEERKMVSITWIVIFDSKIIGKFEKEIYR